MERRDRSRYSVMEPSTVIDEETGELYPDILTAEYQDFDFTTMPMRIRLLPQYVDKPFNLMRDYYDTYVGEDILLDLNLIPHWKYMEPGMSFYIPHIADFERFVKSKTRGERRRI